MGSTYRFKWHQGLHTSNEKKISCAHWDKGNAAVKGNERRERHLQNAE